MTIWWEIRDDTRFRDVWYNTFTGGLWYKRLEEKKSRHEGLSIESRDETKLVQEQETQTLQTLVKSSSSLFRPLFRKEREQQVFSCLQETGLLKRVCHSLLRLQERFVWEERILRQKWEKKRRDLQNETPSLTSKYRRSFNDYCRQIQVMSNDFWILSADSSLFPSKVRHYFLKGSITHTTSNLILCVNTKRQPQNTLTTKNQSK